MRKIAGIAESSANVVRFVELRRIAESSANFTRFCDSKAIRRI